jgi:ubiquinone/menaquinone biosynthesis C-methylase UbiE
MNAEQVKAMLKDTFNTVSGAYDNPVLRFFPASARHLADLLRLRGDERVLDVATGTGHAALEFARRLPRGHVTGVDFSAGMLEQARQKAAARGAKNVEFAEMDMQALNFDAASFDAATCAYGIFFVEDMDAALAHVAERVKPGGTVAICNFQKDYFFPLRELLIRRLAHCNVQLPPQTWERIATEAGCRELFQKAGLRDIRVEPKNMGYFLADENEWWDVVWNAGFRRMVSQLRPADLARFRAEHLQEVAALKTKEGLWLDIGVLFTKGEKA